NWKYINRMPKDAKIFIVTPKEDLYQYWANAARDHDNIEIRLQENRGRNEAAYWITCRDVIQSFDYICLTHDKKTARGMPALNGQLFAKHCFDSLIKSGIYVENIISLFESNPRLGLLMPPPTSFAGFENVIDTIWENNIGIAKDLYDELKLTIPFDMDPISPWGAMFWIRGKAMSAIFRKNWQMSDFPEEPVPDHGTILHALEHMYPMIAQESGYLSAWIMPLSRSDCVFCNIYHLLSFYKQRLKNLPQAAPEQISDNSSVTLNLKKIHSKDIRLVLKNYVLRRLQHGFKRIRSLFLSRKL
ncbi:MAG: hypothetical protein HUK26_02300, partial [Duodenibacillus sp.]|nr:hypothetical protein [Duodenibacillus sp.]